MGKKVRRVVTDEDIRLAEEIQDEVYDYSKKAKKLIRKIKDVRERQHCIEYVLNALESAAMACDDLVKHLENSRGDVIEQIAELGR